MLIFIHESCNYLSRTKYQILDFDEVIPETPEESDTMDGISVLCQNRNKNNAQYDLNSKPAKKFKYTPVIIPNKITNRVSNDVEKTHILAMEVQHSQDLFSDTSIIEANDCFENDAEKSPPNGQMQMKKIHFGDNEIQEILVDAQNENIQEMRVDAEDESYVDDLADFVDEKSNCVDENPKIDHGKIITMPKNAFGSTFDSDTPKINIDEIIAALMSQTDSIRHTNAISPQQNPIDMESESLSVDQLIHMQNSCQERINSLLVDTQQSM